MVTSERYRETLAVIDDLLELTRDLAERIGQLERDRFGGYQTRTMVDTSERVRLMRLRVRAITCAENGDDDAER